MTSGYDPQTAARLAAAGDDPSKAFARRGEPRARLAGQAGAVTETCHAMAVRFHQGGKLVVFGTGAASTDAQHVAVEFVHPVIVGKRALPAISLTTDIATVTGIAEREGMDAIFSHQLRYLAAPGDIALGICATGHCGSVLAGLATATELGMLTISLTGREGRAVAGSPAADHVLLADSDDPRVVKGMPVTMHPLLGDLAPAFL